MMQSHLSDDGRSMPEKVLTALDIAHTSPAIYSDDGVELNFE